MSTPRRRTRDGCWTCKSRRQKCDNTTPTCLNCRRAGRECGGFQVRLKWGTGIASRGKFSGAVEPTSAYVRSEPAGRQRDNRKLQQSDGALVVLEPPPADPCSGTAEEALFDEFLRSGIKMLHGSPDFDDAAVQPTLATHLPQLSRKSPALYAVCVALQSRISEGSQHEFLAYLDAALIKFRAELAQCTDCLSEATWTAGLLLCTVGIMNGSNYSVHLRGMDQIISASAPPINDYTIHQMEVMGVMDMTVFTLGRQKASLGIWNRHCTSGGRFSRSRRADVEQMSGLPRSLLDLLSAIGHGTTEMDFWNWPGAQGSFVQQQLWEAYRSAAILSFRHSYLKRVAIGTQPVGSRAPPSTAILVSRVLSGLEAITNAFKLRDPHGTASVNTIVYPTIIAGLTVEVMNMRPHWQDVVRECLTATAQQHGQQNQLLLALLEELWERDDDTIDVDALLIERGTELGLL